MITKEMRLLPGRPLSPVHFFGRPKPTCCEGRGCPDRTAPVFVVGALFLCTVCRDYRNDLIRKQQAAQRTQARWQGRVL